MKQKFNLNWMLALGVATGLGSTSLLAVNEDITPESIPGAKQRNVIFILADDHRYDAMGFMGHSFLETPTWMLLLAMGCT